jgi:hypothetical protein
MPNAVDETSAVTATVFATRLQPDPPRAAPEQLACDSEQRCHETQTELASANRVAIQSSYRRRLPKSTSRSALSS